MAVGVEGGAVSTDDLMVREGWRRPFEVLG